MCRESGGDGTLTSFSLSSRRSDDDNVCEVDWTVTWLQQEKKRTNERRKKQPKK